MERLLAIFLIICGAFQQGSAAENEDIETLSRTAPFANALLASVSQDPGFSDLYARQIKALEGVLASGERNRELAELLIPFLGYSNSPAIMIGHMRRENKARVEEAFPAFKIMMEIPGSELVLQEYSLNSSERFGLRLLAYTALSYKNPKLFRETRRPFEATLENPAPFVKYYLPELHDGKIGFWCEVVGFSDMETEQITENPPQ